MGDREGDASLRRALEVQEQVLGRTHPETLKSSGGLTVALKQRLYAAFL